MQVSFEVKRVFENTFGHFVEGIFLEETPFFSSNQFFKLGQYQFEIFGNVKAGVWTLKLMTEGVFNEVLEEQIVQIEIL